MAESADNTERLEIDDDLCKGCEICITFCPLKVFANSDKLNRKGYCVPVVADGEACNGCKMCELLCPEIAIIVHYKKKAKTRS